MGQKRCIFARVTCVGLPSTIIVSACGSWKANELDKSDRKVSCASLTSLGFAGTYSSPSSLAIISPTLFHLSFPGSPAVRLCLNCLDRVATSQLGSDEDPDALPLCPCRVCPAGAGLCILLPRRRRALLLPPTNLQLAARTGCGEERAPGPSSAGRNQVRARPTP